MERPRPNEEAVREQLRETAAPEPEPAGSDPQVAPRGSGPQTAAAGTAQAAEGSDPAESAEGSDPLAQEPQQQEGPEPQQQEDPLAKAERERDEYLDLAQRTRAELENVRKRAARDTAQAGQRAKANLVRELLPVLDNLERALASAGEAEQHLAEGVRMVHGQLVAALEREGVEAFDPAGEPFDPERHEALSTREDGEAGRVLDVVEKGYRSGGSVLRPARVVVSA